MVLDNLVRTCMNVKSHIEKIEKGLDLNIQLGDSPLTRLSLLSGYWSYIYWAQRMRWTSFTFQDIGPCAHRGGIDASYLLPTSGIKADG